MLDDSATPPTRAKRYAGKVVRGRRLVNVFGDSGSRPLRCLDFNTPTFGWGFHGSAADELAIAILSEHFGASEHTFDTRVLRMYRAFVDDVVSKFSHGGAWTLSDRSVAKWISAQRA
jgi:hypothetical protein